MLVLIFNVKTILAAAMHHQAIEIYEENVFSPKSTQKCVKFHGWEQSSGKGMDAYSMSNMCLFELNGTEIADSYR